jgi:serine/threonine protein kinase
MGLLQSISIGIANTLRTQIPHLCLLRKITDFGFSTAGTSKRLLSTKNKGGTPCYAAPEIMTSESHMPAYTNKVDIWALGLMLYELMMGKRAFQTDYQVIRYYTDCKSALVTTEASLKVRFPEAKEMDRLISRNNPSLRIAAISMGSGPKALKSEKMKPGIVYIINNLLCLLLHREPFERPSARQVMVSVGGYRLFYSLFCDGFTSVSSNMLLKMLYPGPRDWIMLLKNSYLSSGDWMIQSMLIDGLSDTDQDTMRLRWQFLTEIDVCSILGFNP